MNNPYENWINFFQEALNTNIPIIEKIEELVYLGIGGSGIPGRILEILELPVKYQLFRGYKVKVNEKSTVIAVSYSGNTTETIFALLTSLKKTRKAIVITSGGKIEEIAIKYTLPVIKLPKGLQTRFVFPYIFTYLIRIINEGLGTNYNVNELVEGTKDYSKLNEISGILASQIIGKIPIIYSSTFLPIAERFKQEINENAKYPAFYNELPEANHNEIELYSYPSPYTFYPIVIVSDKLDEESANLINAYKIYPLYQSILKNIASLTLLAGLTSVKLAMLLGVKPEQLNIIPKIREKTFKLFEGDINANQNL
ncbi:bifunctional phosphoglucose/phosphomannose isomerase [Sulfurisphaera ohwakuensis]|uniref:bifunctional phosphoglucose/phosphomannose isomerase n=1 Tax=Sulfurisphaera ohwakuensis TaxID=69656 RepID=UPI0036F28AC2